MSVLVSSVHSLVKETSGEQTYVREKAKGGWLGKGCLSLVQKPVCHSPSLDSQNPNLLQSLCGAGGSNTLAGTELPLNCYRTRSSRSSFSLKPGGWWWHFSGWQHDQGVCEVTSWSCKSWMRAIIPGKNQTTLRCREDIKRRGKTGSRCKQQV